MLHEVQQQGISQMIGLDTNVLVRCIMPDDAVQSPKASEIIEALDGVQSFGYVTLVAVIELVWVLGTSYELTRTQVARALDSLIRARQRKLKTPTR